MHRYIKRGKTVTIRCNTHQKYGQIVLPAILLWKNTTKVSAGLFTGRNIEHTFASTTKNKTKTQTTPYSKPHLTTETTENIL